MDFLSLFNESWQLVWQRKSLWVLGALLGISDLTATIGRVLLGPLIQDVYANSEAWFLDFVNGQLPNPDQFQQFAVQLIGWTLGLSAIFLVVWLIVTWADASLITAVSTNTTFSTSLKTGARLIKRFVAIDALVFLPWFLLALLIMLLFGGVIIGSGLIAVQGGENTAVTIFLIGLACVVPLSCLLIPLSYASLIFRLLAFRDAALQNRKAREAIRCTWGNGRKHLGTILILLILIVGGVSLINLLLNWGAVPLSALLTIAQTAGILSVSGLGAILITCVFLLIILLLKAILHALSATIWTLAYQKLSTNLTEL